MEPKEKKDLFLDLVKELLRYHAAKECPIQHIIEEAETIISSMEKIGNPDVEIIEDEKTKRYNIILNYIKIVFGFDSEISSQLFTSRYFNAVTTNREMREIGEYNLKKEALRLGIISKVSRQRYKFEAS